MEYLSQNIIDHKHVNGSSTRIVQSLNPAHPQQVVSSFHESSAEDVHAAALSAKKAFKAWSLWPAQERAKILYKTAELLMKYKEDLATLETREMGKTIEETRGDVQEAIDCALLYAGEGRRWFGQTIPSELPDKFCMTVRRPVGVCGLITAWNFPIAVPSWKIIPALICGNTLVFKPAEDAPHSGQRLVEILIEAGLPKGVLNLVQGTGEITGEALLHCEHIDLISFTGSTQTGSHVAEVCGKTLKRVALEMGGKNASIIMPDANLELALDGILWGAFATSGQRCTATSRLIIHKSIKDDFLKKLIAQTQQLRIGDGLNADIQVGPLVNAKQLERVKKYVEIGINEDRATLVLGGPNDIQRVPKEGFFYPPTIFDKVTPQMRLAREEIFGPVLSVLTFESFDEALEIMNNTPYGLSSSIYTQDVDRVFKAIRDIDAGITYINGPTIGAEVHLPFGGVKNSGNGHREAGSQVLDIFSEWKTVYVDYSGKLQRAQMDNN